MFPYRLTISGRLPRILVAACLAIGAHIVLMGVTVHRVPFSAPHVPLPLSVNVFLVKNRSQKPVEKNLEARQVNESYMTETGGSLITCLLSVFLNSVTQDCLFLSF